MDYNKARMQIPEELLDNLKRRIDKIGQARFARFIGEDKVILNSKLKKRRKLSYAYYYFYINELQKIESLLNEKGKKNDK